MSPGSPDLKWTIQVLILLMTNASLLMISGCIESGGTDEIDMVVVSIAPQQELVERISGDQIEVVVMVPESLDPHTYSPNPSQLLKVAKADIYFMMGSGIEFEELNMDTIRETNRKIRTVDMSEGIEVVSYEDHGVEHDHEDLEEVENDGTDPHIWLDPGNMLRMADTVLLTLISEDPMNEELYKANHASYVSELGSVMEEVGQELMPYSGRSFLTYHPAWGYFADAFGLIQISVEEGGKEPGPQGMASLVDQASDSNITVIFVEPQFDTSTAEQIADAIGGKVVTVDPLAGDYMENIRKVADDLVEGFRMKEDS